MTDDDCGPDFAQWFAEVGAQEEYEAWLADPVAQAEYQKILDERKDHEVD